MNLIRCVCTGRPWAFWLGRGFFGAANQAQFACVWTLRVCARLDGGMACCVSSLRNGRKFASKNWAYVLRGGRGKWPDAPGRVGAGRSIRVAFVSCCCVLSAGNRAQPVARLDFEALPFGNYGALLTYAVGLVRSRARGESGLLGGIAFEHTVINLSAQDLQQLLLHETVWVFCR